MSTKKQINIFIVDDNRVFMQALQADIENAFIDRPIKIHLFITGETCMLKFKEIRPQIVILDYHLNSKFPDAADGVKVLDWIRNENTETSIIMLTVDDHIDIAIKSFRHGASDYVVKKEVQGRKIFYSLSNLFKIMEAKSEARRYKHIVIGFLLFNLLLIGGMIAIRISGHLVIR